ncbi:MAG: SBBP repeat-containing protein [Lewinellaceae bacterium]|nr:SBBP repeat-containing protein [Lewinellaceae bacterium]
MKTHLKLFLPIFLSLFCGACVLAQEYKWSVPIGSLKEDDGNSMAVDKAGNLYITGSFWGIADFDPGDNTFNLDIIGFTYIDVFLAKYDPAGKLVWAKSIGGGGPDVAYEVAVDAGGNVYITGSFFYGFNPGSGVPPLDPAGQLDVFMVKYDTDGNCLWAKGFGGFDEDAGFSMALDVSGNIYIAGYFAQTADFDPGPGVAELTSAGQYDLFFAKYTTDGAFVWAKSIGGTGQDYGEGILISYSGEVYVTGRFVETADFDPGPGIANLTVLGSSSQTDVFLAKYDNDGNYLWANRIGGESGDYSWDLALDNLDNVFISGNYGAPVDFDPGPGEYILNSFGPVDAFFAKYDKNGAFQWAKGLGGNFNDSGTGIATDKFNNVYATGDFAGLVDLDPGPGSFYKQSIGGYDVFFSKFDTDGNFTWAQKIGGNDGDYSREIIVSDSGHIVLSGIFKGSNVDFDPGAGTTNLSAVGYEDAFFAKYSQLPAAAGPVSGDTIICHGAFAVFALAPVINATGYHWTLSPGATIVSDSNSSSIVVQFADTATTFTVQVYGTNEFGGGASSSMSGTILPAFYAVVTPSDTIVCEGKSVQITASVSGGLPTYSYTWYPSDGLDNSSIGDPVATPNVSTSYVLRTSDAAGCELYDTITILVTPSPVATIAPAGAVGLCTGDFILFVSNSLPGLTYQWLFNGSSISGASDSVYSAKNVGVYRVYVSNFSGCANLSDSVVVADQLVCDVWPGDTDVDHTANNNDILPIGLFFGQTGTPRASAGNDWQAYAADDWGAAQANTFDVKHVDCNGDGAINSDDTLAVFLNFNATHAFAPTDIDDRQDAPPIFFVTNSSTYQPGDWVDVELWLGTSTAPVDDLYGIAFNIDYNTNLVSQYPPVVKNRSAGRGCLRRCNTYRSYRCRGFWENSPAPVSIRKQHCHYRFPAPGSILLPGGRCNGRAADLFPRAINRACSGRYHGNRTGGRDTNLSESFGGFVYHRPGAGVADSGIACGEYAR